MKRIFILLIVSVSFYGCRDACESSRTYTFFEPTYESLESVRSQFKVTEPATIRQPGKIYLYGNLVFVNEVGEGVHIIDNQEPADPKEVAFINIPGNFDIAVKDNILFADSYIDLLMINISDIQNIQLVNRMENAFPGYNTQFGFEAVGGNVIVGWEEKETVEMFDYCQGSGVVPLSFGFATADAGFAESSIGGQQGIGGSLARFAIQQQFLYAVDSYDMHIFDVTVAADPKKEEVIHIGWDVETIFPYKSNVFIGARSGMFIYDCSSPGSPQYLSEFIHATACDPVVANDAYAFVTLRTGSECEGFSNQLDIIDIGEITQPILVKTVQMQNPFGLGLDGNTLFVCEGEFGMKVFDISDPLNPSTILTVNTIQVHDVIPWNNVLLAIGEEGLYQYDYEDLQDIKLLSFIAFDPPEGE